MHISEKHLNRFRANVEVTEDGCHVWTGTRDSSGYGQFFFNGRTMGAHRFAALIEGETIDGLCVCHDCDNPSCVNPDHLTVGDRAYNARDRDRKGRTARGEDHGIAKLTEDEVVRMREVWASGCFTLKQVGYRYDCSPAQVFKIVTGEHWSHVGGPIHSPHKLTDEEVADIRRRFWWDYESQVDLADEYGIQNSYVSMLVRGLRRPDAGGPTSHERPPMPPPSRQVAIRLAIKTGRSIRDVQSQFNLPRSMIIKIIEQGGSSDSSSFSEDATDQ